ncbi:TetR family transcriptional regulator [Rhodococcus fascians]|nr:TetR family transcriptional regulator [Rhodococcus fascians]MBY3824206.1 TetR family transcriptional regulator [Rhodococcus fascians]MBY3834728.1 TetR family transcriptional regulator [Rhodococcus fascians]MBY3863940.1 TetR family transcriptional regulator [Rhodococcus fascians]MBY3883411.1 TetR family transcriptional regulator [Rhodococcus fascians]
MGLREKHAAQTRELILDAAFPLFLERGYEQTTMEEIAARAQVGTTTLYRYYPSKDMLVMGPLELNGQMATEFRSRPADEPVEVSLGHAVRAALTVPRAGLERFLQIRQVILQSSSLATRLLEQYTDERTRLQNALADRLGRPSNDLYCRATARTAIMVLELAGEVAGEDTWVLSTERNDDDFADRVLDSVTHVVRQLMDTPPSLPQL